MPFPRPTLDGIPLRAELDPLPDRLRNLVVYRGYPTPWFVAYVDGLPEFRAADAGKRVRAVRERLCWVCGEPLGRWFTFVIGPMCGVTRTTAEPPCHHDCAVWSARNCPFLARPHAKRRTADLPAEAMEPDGFSIDRNPGVTALWVTRSYTPFPDGKGGWLIRMGEPERIEWYAEGRPATRPAVEHSIDTGIPALMTLAVDADRAHPSGDAGEVVALNARVEDFRKHHLPPAPAADPAAPVEVSQR